MNSITWSRFKTRCWSLLGVCALAGLACGQGLPEPNIIFYGTVRNTAAQNLRLSSGLLSWTIRDAASGRTLTLTNALGAYSGFSYILRVPCETIVGGSVSTNALSLAAYTTNLFNRSAVTYNGLPVTFATLAQATFPASSRSRGQIERVDLLVAAPFQDVDGNGIADDWELRYFGYIGVDPNADPDKDGFSNLKEFLAGTDPTDPKSKLHFINYEKLATGGLKVDWLSTDGRNYTLLRTTNLFSLTSPNWRWTPDLTVVRSNILATPPQNSFTDTNVINSRNYFYLLEMEP